MRLLLRVLLCLPLLSSAPVLAWSELGHRIVGALAEGALSAPARAEVDRLLAVREESSLADLSVWPDRARETEAWRHTAPWHYVNFPRDADCRLVPERDCPDGDCIISAIGRQLEVLEDRTRPPEERARALAFVVHLVGDVHQPLHAGYGHDRGGNSYQISLRRLGHEPEGTNMHGIWDWWILSSHSEDWQAWTRALGAQGLITSERDAVRDAAPARWAEESCRIVHEPGFYPRRHRLGTDYLDRWRPVAEKRLREAAGRLVMLLEHALG